MALSKLFTLVFLSNFLLFSSFVFQVDAQTMRSPTPQEKTAIEKVINAVMPVLTPFSDDTWVLEDGGPDQPEYFSVAIQPEEPIGTAPFTDMRFEMKQGSELWNREMKPLLDKIEHPDKVPSNDEEAAAFNKLTNEYENKSKVVIEVHVNEKNIEVKPVKGGPSDLKIPGCYFSYKQSNNPGSDEYQAYQYTLVFGKWSTAKVKDYSDVPFYEFSYVHPKGSPYIENIVVILKGNNKRINELLGKIDWSNVNKGLTQ